MYLTFCGIGITNAKLFQLSAIEFNRNRVSCFMYLSDGQVLNIYFSAVYGTPPPRFVLDFNVPLVDTLNSRLSPCMLGGSSVPEEGHY